MPQVNPAAVAENREISVLVTEERWHRGYASGLLALTLLSAFFCFNRLWVPPLLIDECFTYWRVCGNLDQLLDTLRNDAFMPLHYEILNWIGQGFPIGWGMRLIPGGIFLTPTVMRFIPAMCGTLMTPVMYFTARQIFNRRTAIIAAAFITCSAYSVFFSRNAKMYAPAWMFETLTIGCLGWWLRTWRRDAWLCWIFAGIAAGGFHAITLLLLPLAPLYFISVGRYSGSRIPLLLIGIFLILFSPAVYYGVCNRWTQNSGGIVPGVVGEPVADANWDASGLNWIEPADDSIRLPLTAVNAFFSGMEWTGLSDLADSPPLLQHFGHAMIVVAVITYAALMFGALPWPHLRIDQASKGPQPGWRGLFWILLWIVLPTYGFFYCRSVEHFSTPFEWLKRAGSGVNRTCFIGLGGAVMLAIGLGLFSRWAKFLAVPMLLLATIGIYDIARYQPTLLYLTDHPICKSLAYIFVTALVFNYCGSTFRQRMRQLLILLAIVFSVILLCEAAAVMWRSLHAISMRKNPQLPWKSVWQIRYVAIVMPGVWLGAAGLIARLPTRWIRVCVVLLICFYNSADVLARQYIQTNVPLDRAMADMFLSQPESNVRTYFALRPLTDNIYYRPLAAYNACIAAHLHPAPADFRFGYTWPFQWGAVASQFKNACVFNPSLSSKQLRHDTIADPRVTQVIVWEIVNHRSAKPIGDGALAALGSAWKLESDEQIISHWYWTWSDLSTLRRRSFRKISMH